jgi:hypothetical protein
MPPYLLYLMTTVGMVAAVLAVAYLSFVVIH